MARETVVARRVVDPGAVVRQPAADAAVAPVAPVAPVVAFRAWLGSVDVDGLSDAQRVGLVAELERVKGSASAVQARATDALRRSREAVAPRDVARSVGSQVALARRESPCLGDRFVGLARALVHEMPVTMAALAAGEVSERHAVAVVQATACLSRADRAEVDRRLGPVLGRLGVSGAGRAAARVAAELDAASVVARMEAAVASRRVSVRPAPDGMAYLSVLGPLPQVVGAHAALLARSRAVLAGACPDEAPDGRGAGAVAADTALALLSGRGLGEVQPVEVHLVVTDRALLGTGDPGRSVSEPARVPGHGPVPAPLARAWLRAGLEDSGGASDRTGRDGPAGSRTGSSPGDGRAASVWLRRLYTTPGGRDLVAMDSRRRVFGGLLRRMLVLRDDVCTTPWCDAPIVHADHTTPVRGGGRTTWANGDGRCARCNQTKEAPGWAVRVTHPGPAPGASRRRRPATTDVAGAGAATGPGDEPARERRDRRRRVPRKRRPVTATRRRGGSPPRPRRHGPREIEVVTPTGHRYRSHAPPLTGWGWQEPTRPPKRARTASRLERHLLDLLAAA